MQQQKRQIEQLFRKKLISLLSHIQPDTKFQIAYFYQEEGNKFLSLHRSEAILQRCDHDHLIETTDGMFKFHLKKTSYSVNHAMHQMMEFGTPIFTVVESEEDVEVLRRWMNELNNKMLTLTTSLDQAMKKFTEEKLIATQLFMVNIFNPNSTHS